tara:strand:+ start:393 stop:527 length:135 start_codon:yes stop_codon:yes gene_type:complete
MGMMVVMELVHQMLITEEVVEAVELAVLEQQGQITMTTTRLMVE